VRRAGWLDGGSVCNWELVGCGSGSAARVKLLTLSFNNLTGWAVVAVRFSDTPVRVSMASAQSNRSRSVRMAAQCAGRCPLSSDCWTRCRTLI
jgi:hypothetical protein